MLPRILPLLILLACSNPSRALEWREYGPPGGALTALVSDSTPTTVIATAKNHVYRSSDGGMFWESLQDLQANDTARGAVVLDATTPVILICTDSGKVLRWNARTTSWDTVETGIDPPQPPYGRQCYDLSVVSPTATRVFLGCSTGLYYSDNKGDLWRKVPLRNSGDLPQMVESARDGSLYVNTGFSTGTVYRIEPDYSTYTTFVCKPGLPCVALTGGMIRPNPHNADELLLVFSGHPPYYSNDRGENWSTPAGPPPSTPDKGAWLYGKPTVMGVTATYRLDPAAMTWTTLWSRPIAVNYFALPLSKTPGALLLGNTSRGIWRSGNSGQTWEYSSSGMHSSGQVQAIAAVPSSASTLYVGLAQEGVWRTQDGGRTWEERSDGIASEIAYNRSIRSLAVDPSNPNHLLTGTEPRGGDPAKVHQTLDGGGTWTMIPSAPTAIAHKIHFLRGAPSTVLIGTLGDGVWRSTNGGNTWNKLPEFPQYSNINDIAEESGGRLFASQAATFNTQGGIFISDTQGASWTFSEIVGGLRSLAADWSQSGRIMGGFSGGGMVFSLNNGVGWNPVNTGLNQIYGTYGDSISTVVDRARSGHYYTSMFGTGIYGTEDEGQHWTRLASHYTDFPAGGELALTDREMGTLFAAVEGVYYAQLHEPLPTLTPTPTRSQTPAPTVYVTPTYTPPPGFPPHPTPTSTLPISANAGVTEELFWMSPSTPGSGQSVSVGVVVFNNSTTNLSNVPLDFYWRSDTAPRTHFANRVIPSLPQRSRVEVPSAGSFVAPSPGTYYVEAVADEQNQIMEYDESDNLATVSFYARQIGADSTSPSGSIEVLGGGLFTSNWEVGVHFNATDAGSGVAYMWVTAWELDPYSGGLYPYFDSGWVPYTSYASLPLALVFSGDINAISVNYADLDENISDTYWGVVNYYPVEFPDYVWWDEVLYYPMYLPSGANVTVTVQHEAGDTDLYILAPSTPSGFSQWSSVHDGGTSENIAFTTFEEGVHWALVYGYDFSVYRVLCSGSGSFKGSNATSPAPLPLGDRRGPELENVWNSGLLPSGAHVPPVGLDLNLDRMIDSQDLFYFSRQWGKTPGEAGYDARCGTADPETRTGAKHLLRWLGMR
ncbi:MAG: hypothetical protein HUU16_01495 [Candidatus Omnitrophica bacterium]|nr:hypothetical protein [Candidatus Omnitrophota bacterium]